MKPHPAPSQDLPQPARRQRRVRRKDARPGELLDAALDLFVQKGYAATRVEEVAARAGVSKGTLFLYFPSKEDLFKAVVRENIAGRFSEWQLELDSFEGDSEALLRRCYAVWWERIGSTRASGITKLMVGEARNFPALARFYHQEVTEPGTALVRRILERGIARGEIRTLDLQTGVYLVLAPMVFLTLWQNSMAPCLPGQDAGASLPFSPEAYLETQIDNLLRGLRP
ncbi:TetR/AcrR family transcriptional regulator [Comamonas endophytica]|uniref:TetR/AcrR family transcriptional regulator n=1 Tax=Comamonas endophytica TaxID=2949090 RepID=A0ABY6G9J1_9BURK|nr:MULTISPECIES: TetR/AcrR family transcriptional regulator [unclassified Acidovorax]MCD2511867.1 TetR/AcrR family transcriptional regulator [Acidovorax sp. D4N7]UYG51588.1 TetR/AcrR family transcriptional regulator [Acidovorax sp. 5MLIR]